MIRLTSKETLRRSMIEIREELSQNAAPKVADILAAKILLLREMRNAKIISAYYTIGSEMDVLPALKAFHVAHHDICLPIVVKKDSPLLFRKWDFKSELEEAAHGIKQPPASAEELMPDIIIVPLLAFDESCMRIGYGGGFYDRTIAAYRDKGREFITVGAAFEGQKIDHVPCEAFDQKLDIIVTEEKIYRS